MDFTEIESRVARLNTLVSEGRIARNEWFGIDEQGRATACLLAALSPEAGDAENADFCPAAVMPLWLAHITPWIDDACSETAWPRVIRRYAACAARWSALDDAAWRRVEIATRRAAVEEAMRHTSNKTVHGATVLGACRGVLVWLDADMPESSQAAVKMAAQAAAWAAVADRQAAAAAQAAAWAASGRAAEARAAAQAAVAQARVSVESADRIIDVVLSALEKECGL